MDKKKTSIFNRSIFLIKCFTKSATANHVMLYCFACYACIMSQMFFLILYLVYLIFFILGGGAMGVLWSFLGVLKHLLAPP